MKTELPEFIKSKVRKLDQERMRLDAVRLDCVGQYRQIKTKAEEYQRQADALRAEIKTIMDAGWVLANRGII